MKKKFLTRKKRISSHANEIEVLFLWYNYVAMKNQTTSYSKPKQSIFLMLISDSIEDIFNDINKEIFDKEKADFNHLYIDGLKFEANANKYSWVWKKTTEKSRYRLYEKLHIL